MNFSRWTFSWQKRSVTYLLRKVIYANNLLPVLMREKKSNNWIKWLLQFDLPEQDEKKPKCSKCSIIKYFDDETPFLSPRYCISIKR